MPAYVVPFRCDGCGACIKVCPSGILHIDGGTRKAFNIEPEMCWECYPCAKACPQDAIQIRGYSDFVPLGATLHCKRDTLRNTITWTVRFRNGVRKQFSFPIRTTPWDSIRAPAEQQVPPPGALRTPLLAFEPDYLMVPELPSPRKK